ncbi:MAG: arsenate reductase ArsC [Maricaulaceae bacterium]
MTDTYNKPYNVLFLCTGNSARSILSEALLNDLGKGRFIGWSAGSKPSGQPHPVGLAELQARGHRTDIYRSKSWDEFADMDVQMDLVVTVCSQAANEVCPVFPGKHMRVHWPAEDPAHIEPLEACQKAFRVTYDICRARIEALIAMSESALASQSSLQKISEIDV